MMERKRLSAVIAWQTAMISGSRGQTVRFDDPCVLEDEDRTIYNRAVGIDYG